MAGARHHQMPTRHRLVTRDDRGRLVGPRQQRDGDAELNPLASRVFRDGGERTGGGSQRAKEARIAPLFTKRTLHVGWDLGHFARQPPQCRRTPQHGSRVAVSSPKERPEAESHQTGTGQPHAEARQQRAATQAPADGPGRRHPILGDQRIDQHDARDIGRVAASVGDGDERAERVSGEHDRPNNGTVATKARRSATTASSDGGASRPRLPPSPRRSHA